MIRFILTFLLMFWLAAPSDAQIVINEYCCSNLNKFADNYGEYEDFIELYNTGTNVITLTGYYLSDNPANPTKWIIPDGVTINGHGFKKIWCSGRNEYSAGNLHTSYHMTQTKIPPESVVLSDPSGTIIDQHTIEITENGHSRGRTTDGSSSWSVFTTPTPGATNTTSTAYTGYTQKPLFSVPAGFYPGPVSVAITTGETGVTLRYTLDGTEPTSASQAYSVPVSIPATRILKARAFSSNTSILPGLIEFDTYLINESHTLPVVSIAANNLKNLLNGNGGLMPEGSIEYFDENKVRTTTAYGQFGKHGQDSWVHPQRSLDYKSRDEMGYNFALQEKFFTQSDREEFQRIILRACGDDNYPGIDTSAHIRDDYVETLALVAGQNLDVRKSRRCVIYTNGDYWGVYSIREKVDDHDYTSYYYNQGKYDLHYMLLWGSSWPEYGGQACVADWENLYTFITTHDMSVQANYDSVISRYDPTSLTDYMLINSLAVCSDWLNWNVGWWRGLNPEGDHQRWGYILWDEDATFGHYINYTGIPSQSPYLPPCFHESLVGLQHDPEGHVTVLNKLLENEGFREYYINRYVDLMNTGFRPEIALGLLDSLASVIEPEMPQHYARWGGNNDEWLANVQKIRNFYNIRYGVIWNGMNNCYNTTGPYPVTVDLEPAGAGYVKLNSLTLKDFPFSGQYFGGIHIALEAVEANPGFEFDHWEVSHDPVLPSDTSKDVTISLSAEESVLAVFRPRLLTDSLVINEINYHSASDFNPGDWVEFYNPQNYPLDIHNWKFKDEVDTHEFIFPSGAVLPAHGYMVLAEDMLAFDTLFPGVNNHLGPMGFGLSGNGELIRLYNAAGMIVDTVHYDDTAPWPTEPDGGGPTLELINPGLDNALAASWKASCEPHGTPGAQNCVYISVQENNPQEGSLAFLVIPNPVQTSARIIVKTDRQISNGMLTIFNVLGHEVARITGISEKEIVFQRGTLPPGSYYFRFHDATGNFVGTGKLILE
jgi:hypothetical protein